MNDFERAVVTLEFDKIRETLASLSPTSGSAEMAKKLMPSSNPDTVRRMQAETEAARKRQTVKGMPPLRGITDISVAVDRAQKGATLTIRELIETGRIYTCARQMLEYNNSEHGEDDEISVYFSMLSVNRAFENRIEQCFINDETVADTASGELYDIRRKMRAENNRIRDSLQKYITSSVYSKYLQDQLVTMRDGRYVIPVRAEYKNEIKGLVHDVSSSGATLFIEPLSVVESNNELKVLEKKEADEIERILSELSALTAQNGSELLRNYHNINILALIFAKSQLSFRYRGAMPEITDKRCIRLVKARHPLINADTVVPVTVNMGGDCDSLIITGPNTGGKTVTLKTLGLFSMMAQSGLQLPVSDGSSLCVFDGILADIGDEQSIEQSLSTFSSHMVNIVDILSKAGERSLVLLDELGAGTDPVEGAALAVSILEELRERKSLIAATTHYAELKSYAIETDGVMNASCEFDITTLRPTYRLIIGTPGKSNAFAISKRLGMPDSVTDRAERYISGENRRFEDVIERLEKTRIEMEKSRDEARRLEAEMKAEKAESDSLIAKREAESQKELERARATAVRTVESAKASSEYIFAELEKVKKQRESERLSDALTEARKEIKRHLKENASELDPVSENTVPEDYVLPRPLKKDDEVVIVSIKQKGVLLADPDSSGNVTVRAGQVRTRTNISNLMLIDGKRVTFSGNAKKQREAEYKPQPLTSFSPELDLRGNYGEDACIRLDKYLDEAKCSSTDTVRIIHGKGTGALRKAVTAFLRNDPRVQSVRVGDWGEGDTGVTVVTLK